MKLNDREKKLIFIVVGVILIALYWIQKVFSCQ